jgi:hypothetical protein
MIKEPKKSFRMAFRILIFNQRIGKHYKQYHNIKDYTEKNVYLCSNFGYFKNELNIF